MNPTPKKEWLRATVYNLLDRPALGFPAEISTAPSLSLPSFHLVLYTRKDTQNPGHYSLGAFREKYVLHFGGGTEMKELCGARKT